MNGLVECLASGDQDRLCAEFFGPLSEEVVRSYKTELRLSWDDREELVAECQSGLWMRRQAWDERGGDAEAWWFFRCLAVHIVRDSVRGLARRQKREGYGNRTETALVA